MYFTLLFVLPCLLKCHCLVKKDENEDHCRILKLGLEDSTVSVELGKNGFHREVLTTVEIRAVVLSSVRVLLLYSWPSGIYVDPYQLTSLSNQRDLQMLLDSTIDLELPAHKTSGFSSYVYPSYTAPITSPLKVDIPVHGRYHKPSFSGKTSTSISIEPPELFLWSEKCTQLDRLNAPSVLEAPCTDKNSSTCSWLKVRSQQELSPMSLQLPVGDGSAMAPVCGGTLLVTMTCCAVLSKYMWKHML